MKFKRLLSTLVVTSMLFAVGCGNKAESQATNATSEKQAGGTIAIVAGGDPNSLNPLFSSDRVSMTVNNTLFAPLYVEESNGDLTYFLAESLKPSEDKLTYTLILKNNLKWHDGQPITADDVVFTMEKILDKSQNTFLRDLFVYNDKAIEVKKIDDKTVEFKLPTVSSTFISSLTQVLPIPKHIYDGEADLAKSAKNANPIGSGPFKFKEHKKGESIVLEKFDDYVGGKPNLDSVVYRILGDNNTANIALQNGEVGAKYITPNDVENMKATGNLQVETYNEGMLDNLVFLQQNNEALKNKDVRQAIAYAINKDELIKAAYKSEEFAAKAYSVFTPDTKYYSEEVNKFDSNVEKSKELLTKAGVKDLKLKLGYSNNKGTLESEALIIQQNLKEIGITVELVPMERTAFVGKLFDPKNNKEFDLALNGYVMGVEPDSYKSVFVSGQPYNTGDFKSSKVDELFAKGAVETDKAKREAIYKEIQQVLVDDLAVYPMAYPKSVVAIGKQYGGVKDARLVPIFMFRDLSKLYMQK